MEECITSDNADSGKGITYPKRIVDEEGDGDYDEDTMDDDEGEEEEENSDEDFTPESNSGTGTRQTRAQRLREAIPLELRRDHMTVEEVAEEEYRRAKEDRIKKLTFRETRSNATGDTRVTFHTSQKGGTIAIFRGYAFYMSSRKERINTSYWHCRVKKTKCRCNLVLLNDKFRSFSGEHNHPPNGEEKLKKVEAKNDKLEKERMSRERRLEVIRQKEIERRNNVANGIIVPEETYHPTPMVKKTKNILKPPRSAASAARAAAEEDEDIDNLPGKWSFDMDFFDQFVKKMEIHFGEVSNYGLLQNDLKRDWDTIKVQVKEVAKMRNRVRDQRFWAMRTKCDKAMVDMEIATESKRLLDQRIKCINVSGAELIIKQIKELQGKNEIFSVVNGEVVAVEVDEWKLKFEEAAKERDMLKLKLKNLASVASSSLAFLSESAPQSEAIELTNNSHTTTAATPVAARSAQPSSSRAPTSSNRNQNRSATTVEVVHNQHHQTPSHHHHHHQPAMPSYSQTLRAGPHEPVIVLYEPPRVLPTGWQIM